MKNVTYLLSLVFSLILIGCGDGEPNITNPGPSEQLSAEEFRAYVEQNFQACDQDSECIRVLKGCDDSCMSLPINLSFTEELASLSCDTSQIPCALVDPFNYDLACVDSRCALVDPE